MRHHRLVLGFGLGIFVAIAGCVPSTEETKSPAVPVPAEKKNDVPAAEVKKVPLSKNITLEIQGDKRRVRINAMVCLREGLLEQLLTRNGIKAHESVLTAEIDARELHAALMLAGAEPGKPVQFRPKLAAPTGTTIKVFLEYQDKGKNVRVPAQEWILNHKTKKDLHTDWVFAGSFLDPDPTNPKNKPFYRANDGDVITVVNFEGACIDVPFLNTKDNADLVYVANTARIPPEKTPVSVILEPVIEKKKK